MYSPLEQEAHSCKSVHNHLQQKFNFSGWMCLWMLSCRIWAAKLISKIPSKYVHFLHKSPSSGSLKSFISSSMGIIFSRFFHTAFKFCCISMRHETKFLKICFPPSLGSIILPTAPKEFLFKGFFLGPVPVRLPPLKTPLDLQKVMVKPVVFQNFHFSHSLGSSMHQNCLFI